MKMNDVIQLEMGDQKMESNDNLDLTGLLETTGMMSSGVLSLQEMTQGVSGSCFNLESYASGILTCQNVANQNLGGLVSSASQTVGYTAELNSQAQMLVPMINRICNGVVMIAKNMQNKQVVFISVPNEGARYGKLGPTKIRAEPYIGQYEKLGRRKVKGLKNTSRQLAAGGKGDQDSELSL